MSARRGDGSLLSDLEAYLHHLETVRNVSPQTLRAYAGDLAGVVAGLEELGTPRSEDVTQLAMCAVVEYSSSSVVESVTSSTLACISW